LFVFTLNGHDDLGISTSTIFTINVDH
jgi:hypothetical protein